MASLRLRVAQSGAGTSTQISKCLCAALGNSVFNHGIHIQLFQMPWLLLVSQTAHCTPMATTNRDWCCQLKLSMSVFLPIQVVADHFCFHTHSEEDAEGRRVVVLTTSRAVYGYVFYNVKYHNHVIKFHHSSRTIRK